jgi:uncharacterized protein (TIGR03086 family)
VSPAVRHLKIAERFTSLVEAATDWDAPSPVEGWRARDVVGHLVGWFPSFLSAGAGITLPVGPSIETDPAGAWLAHCDAVQSLLDDPATATRTLTNRNIGEMPLDVAVDQFYTSDVFMHTWDLARAAGADDTLDPRTCAELLAGMEAAEDAIRASGHYGQRVEVPPDSDVQTRLVAFIGRDPWWRPAG